MNEFKKSLCEAIVKEYCDVNETSISLLTKEDVYNSSTLGIALEWLKERDDIVSNSEVKSYLQSRFGVMYIYTNGFALTLRDILEDKYTEKL